MTVVCVHKLANTSQQRLLQQRRHKEHMMALILAGLWPPSALQVLQCCLALYRTPLLYVTAWLLLLTRQTDC